MHASWRARVLEAKPEEGWIGENTELVTMGLELGPELDLHLKDMHLFWSKRLSRARQLDIGVIITYDDSAFTRWGSGVSSYRAARASLSKVVDFLEGKYSAVVRVPIWCIGIE